MTRPWKTWLVFGICCAVLLAAMGWISVTAVRLDRLQQQAAGRADFEELVRLALWRMDSWLTPIIVEETARPASAYRAFAPTANAYTKTLSPLRQGDVLVPSPLLAYSSSNVLLHFELGADGKLTSPQVPPPAQQQLAESGYTTPERIFTATEQLGTLREALNRAAAATPLPALSSGSQPNSSTPPRETVTFARFLFREIASLPLASATPAQLTVNQNSLQANADPRINSAQAGSQLPALPGNDQIRANEQTAAQNDQQLVLAIIPANVGANNGNMGQGQNGMPIRQGKVQDAEQVQQLRNTSEFNRRANVYQQAQNVMNYDNNLTMNSGMVVTNLAPVFLTLQPQDPTQSLGQVESTIPNQPPTKNSAALRDSTPQSEPRASAQVEITPVTGVIQPYWLGEVLVLARRAESEAGPVVQGCWLNWPNIKASLLDSIRDILPAADLQPLATTNGLHEARALAVLPVQLVLSPSPVLPAASWTPVQTSLAVAWTCVVLAGLASALLLHGTLSLSERRAAFVSAVTHELRTPLTTFKMYSEMLADGMVTDESRRRHYLGTLSSEANRLTHLVENVLAYARLERGSARSRLERITLGDLIQRVKPRLADRAAQAGLQLIEDADEATSRTAVHVDVSVVEQILFNLVDNACKYAGPLATEKIIHLEAVPENGKFALLRVRDHGQGISAEVAKRMFQPFNKSATEAAHSAPGVGLGLALCRRLSRSMGGDLEWEFSSPAGACFALRLPLPADGAG